VAIDPKWLDLYELPRPDWRPRWPFTPPGPAQLAFIAEIERAFDGLRLNGGMTWLQGGARDNREDADVIATIGGRDRVERWQDVPDGIIADHPAAHWFLDGDGRRFYLPAAMRFELRYRNRGGCILDGFFADPPSLQDRMTAEQASVYRRFHAWFKKCG
jgi:hypothetical protein